MNRRPVRLNEAKAFLRHHRHSGTVAGWLGGVGVEVDGELVGVGILGRTVAQDRGARVAEITRCCTIGNRNACSMIYGALSRAAEAFGYDSVITYTRADEPGSSLLASGFTREATLPPRDGLAWASRGRGIVVNLFGEPDYEPVERVRWRRTFRVAATAEIG